MSWKNEGFPIGRNQTAAFYALFLQKGAELCPGYSGLVDGIR